MMIDKKIFEEEVIYEKTFPSPLEEFKKVEARVKEEDEDSGEHITFDELIERIYGGIEYIDIPQKAKVADGFVKFAIKLAEEYEIDTLIKRYYSHISVNYYFDSMASLTILRKIMFAADNITLHTKVKGHDVELTLDFYTKAECRNGRQIHP